MKEGLLEEAKEMVYKEVCDDILKEGLEQGLARGREEGIEKGREEGRDEEREKTLKFIKRLLEFGLDWEIIKKNYVLSNEEIERLERNL